MSRAIKMLDNDDDLRKELRASGLEHAQQFSPKNYQERISKLYQRILG
jgi:glycosyltransferase involved in cell wall biosynthesis